MLDEKATWNEHIGIVSNSSKLPSAVIRHLKKLHHDILELVYCFDEGFYDLAIELLTILARVVKTHQINNTSYQQGYYDCPDIFCAYLKKELGIEAISVTTQSLCRQINRELPAIGDFQLGHHFLGDHYLWGMGTKILLKPSDHDWSLKERCISVIERFMSSDSYHLVFDFSELPSRALGSLTINHCWLGQKMRPEQLLYRAR